MSSTGQKISAQTTIWPFGLVISHDSRLRIFSFSITTYPRTR